MKVLSVFGTRPEAIKMAPVIKQLSANEGLHSAVCVTAQHREMLDQILYMFDIHPDFDLDIMKPGQTLADITSAVIKKMDVVLTQLRPDIVLVQGDTSTTFAASLSAYFNHIAIGHIEAGLRTGDMYAPWPEEANRRLTGSLASLHFSPTEQAQRNLLMENVPANSIHVTGNTVIDTLLEVAKRFDAEPPLEATMRRRFSFLGPETRLVLITGHRRENIGNGFESICSAIRRLAAEFGDTAFVYPVHLNPKVRKPVHCLLSGADNIHLIEPQDYLSFIWLMKRSYLILTDSGGIQEEAPSLGKPVIVMRETTERPEAVEAGTVILVGTDEDKIVCETCRLIRNETAYSRIVAARNPFGDGRAAERIVAIVREFRPSKSTANKPVPY